MDALEYAAIVQQSGIERDPVVLERLAFANEPAYFERLQHIADSAVTRATELIEARAAEAAARGDAPESGRAGGRRVGGVMVTVLGVIGAVLALSSTRTYSRGGQSYPTGITVAEVAPAAIGFLLLVAAGCALTLLPLGPVLRSGRAAFIWCTACSVLSTVVVVAVAGGGADAPVVAAGCAAAAAVTGLALALAIGRARIPAGVREAAAARSAADNDAVIAAVVALLDEARREAEAAHAELPHDRRIEAERQLHAARELLHTRTIVVPPSGDPPGFALVETSVRRAVAQHAGPATSTRL